VALAVVIVKSRCVGVGAPTEGTCYPGCLIRFREGRGLDEGCRARCDHRTSPTRPQGLAIVVDPARLLAVGAHFSGREETPRLLSPALNNQFLEGSKT